MNAFGDVCRRLRSRSAACSLVLSVLLVLPNLSGAGSIPVPDFAALSTARAEETIAARRWLHAHPELALREFETQRWLREQLLTIPGIELLSGEWGTGIVAILRGARIGPLVGYRADIDALPLTEATGLPFASTATDTTGGRTVGVMHACGHDLHAAILLGTARVLSKVRDQMPGTVLFVLEPGEEIGAGAQALIAAGLFERAGTPVAIYALHDHPTLLFGQVGYCPEHSAANVDDFSIRVLGRGAHGAYPHRGTDPIVIASQMILAFQSIVSREIDAARQAVITVGSIHGGATSNVIPDAVDLRGTARSFESDVREQLHAAIIRTAKGIASAAGAPEPEIAYILGTPAMYNNPALVEETLPVLQRAVGAENVIRHLPGMGGEDFSEFQKLVPGFMFRLGVGRPGVDMNIHTATFDPDERAIPLGVRLMCAILWDRLDRDTN